MSRLHYLCLLIFIAYSDEVNLDVPCTNDTQCGEPGAICPGSTCQCMTPFYTPCKTSECKIKAKFVYEGEECRVDENCLENADCHKTENRCQCKADYTPRNGLCYKSLNANCTSSTECWSRECRNKICQCPWGFISNNENNRCERKSANIYENWASANASNDFCYPSDPYTCRVSSAVCQNDSQHSEHFCQCPPTYTPDYANQECQLKSYSGLSPSNTTLPLDQCGKCQIDNALCAFVGHQATCWCEASFTKNEDKCVKNQQSLIFPNHNDRDLHDYILNCSKAKNNTLCSCEPGFQFINQTLTCQPIKPKWNGDRIEYGVCTHIDSKGKPVQNYGLCPEPLKCEAREDKHVCSCGVDEYFDEETPTCYHFLGRNLTGTNTTDCPKYSNLNDGKCQCQPNGVFSVSNDDKRCELKLSELGYSQDKSTCDTSNTTGDTVCANLFGGNAKFCRSGECRCVLNNSYYANNTCVTLISAQSGSNPVCPANAENTNDLCECKTGYRVSMETNRTCVRKVKELNETMPSTENALWNLTIDDCKALFPFQPVNVFNNACICDEGAVFNGIICVFTLGFSFNYSDHSMIQCPKNANPKSGSCQCNSGYKQINNTTCDPLTTKVYPHDEITGENLVNITSNDCMSLFGPAAIASENETFCRCRDKNVAFWNAEKCYFLVETDLENLDPDSACPPDSKKNASRCACRPGYQVTNSSKTACEQKPIYSSNLQPINIRTFEIPCNESYTDEDCEALHGQGAVCRDNKCYCDRSRSYVRNNTCELFSQYIFPGIHEYYLYICENHNDCGDHAEAKGIVCEFINENYRVCQCKNDYYFNPIDSTCVENQCYPECSKNEKCQKDRCVCNTGYYRNSSGQCITYDRSWKLHEQCNETYGNIDTEGLECSPDCKHVQCSSGYRNDGSNCVQYRFDDRCAHAPDLCSKISPGSQCDSMENRCTCSPDYYQTDGSRICARGVGLSCTDPLECGDFGMCLNRTCVCRPERKEEERNDYFGRKIKVCINGIDQIRFNSILFLFILIIRVLIA